MKKNTTILFAICLFSLIACSTEKHNYKFEVIEVHDGPVLKKGDSGTEDNKYGFEGGLFLNTTENTNFLLQSALMTLFSLKCDLHIGKVKMD